MQKLIIPFIVLITCVIIGGIIYFFSYPNEVIDDYTGSTRSVRDYQINFKPINIPIIFNSNHLKTLLVRVRITFKNPLDKIFADTRRYYLNELLYKVLSDMRAKLPEDLIPSKDNIEKTLTRTFNRYFQNNRSLKVEVLEILLYRPSEIFQ